MSVSVVIAAYCAEHHLSAAVSSALAQDEPPLEVIVVDDASPDRTLEVARQLADADSRVRVLALPVNAGPGAARNLALDTARGDWVAVLDADDTISRGRLRSMRAAGEEHDADVVVDNFVFRNAVTGALRPSRIPAVGGVEPLDRYDFLRRARAFDEQPTWTLLQPVLRRSFLEAHGLRYPSKTRHGEDYLFMLGVLLAGARAVRVPAPGYVYTERHQGLSTTQLDYDDLVMQTESLLADPRVATDRRAVRLLRRRLAATRCLRAEKQGRLLATAVSDPYVTAVVLRRAARRLRRTVLRPAEEPLPPLL